VWTLTLFCEFQNDIVKINYNEYYVKTSEFCSEMKVQY